MSNRLLGPIVVFFILVGIGVLTPAALHHFKPRVLPELGLAPEFTLTDTDGNSFGSSSLKGHVWVASFFFSSCQGPCPILNANLARLVENFRSNPMFQVTSITTDPDTDSPEVLREYATKFHADPQQWHFLTGALSDIQRISTVGFKLGLAPELKIHSAKVVLVDKTGVIRGYYDAQTAADIRHLSEDAALLL